MTDEAKSKKDSEEMDVGGLFRGTATVTFITEIVAFIMLLGSSIAYVLRGQGWIQSLEPDVAVLLLMVGAIITLFFFLGTIGFFIRFNRRVTRFVISDDIGSVDLSKGRVRTVVLIYVLAVGMILIVGIYSYYLLYKYYFFQQAAESLSFFGITVSIGIFVVAFLVQIVVIVLGRTATKIIRAVLAQ